MLFLYIHLTVGVYYSIESIPAGFCDMTFCCSCCEIIRVDLNWCCCCFVFLRCVMSGVQQGGVETTSALCADVEGWDYLVGLAIHLGFNRFWLFNVLGLRGLLLCWKQRFRTLSLRSIESKIYSSNMLFLLLIFCSNDSYLKLVWIRFVHGRFPLVDMLKSLIEFKIIFL